MKITVVTVVFHAENTIAKTVQSVVEQTMPPYEYLVVDGKSQDGTLGIVERYRPALEARDVRMRVVSEKDNGIYDAMNKGVRLAEGDFILFLNSDDWLERDALAIFQEAHETHPFDFAYGSIRYIGRNGPIMVKASRLDRFVSSRNWNHPSSLVRRELYLAHPFDLSYRVYADFEWFLSVRKSDVRISILPKEKVISNFRAGGASINDDFRASMERAKEKYRAYRSNGYGVPYWFESYGWEFVKVVFAMVYS